jgi:hypothetical protein
MFVTLDGLLCKYGCAMAQVVSRQPLTVEAQVHDWASPCGICGTCFSLSYSVLPRQ